MKNKGRRQGFKSWFVEPYKQVKLGLMFLVVNLVFSALIIGVFGYYIFDIYRAMMGYFQLSQQEGILTLTKFSWPLLVGGGLMFLFVITTIMVSVRETHNIYGPLVSINRFLDEILADQKPSPINLRETDQLQDLAEKLNSVSERLVDDQRAGPMVSVHRFLDDLLDGKTPQKLVLRDDDYFKDLANKLNRVAERLNT